MKIVFMGTPPFAVTSLEMLIREGYHVIGVVTQPDRPKGRKKTLTPPPVKEVALQHGIPVLQPERLKGSEEMNTLLQWEPDLIVTAAFGQMLPKEVLELPPLGCINVHASLLPKYRGGAPIHHALINGEEETGVTIMYMVEKLDAGDMISQARLKIEEDDHVGTLFEKLSILGAELLQRTLPLIEREEVTPIPQRESEVTYAPNIRREDERIEWTKSGKAIYNQIRGLCPFPGAFTIYQGDVIKVWSSKWLEESIHGDPGTVFSINHEGIGVIAGDGTGILLQEIQPAGKKRMRVADFLRGAGSNWTPGIQFGK